MARRPFGLRISRHDKKLKSLNDLITSDVRKFNSAMMDSVKLMEDYGAEFQSEMHLELLERLLNRNPVDTGLSRGNWISTRESYTARVIRTVRTPGEVIAEANRILTGLKLGDKTYIQNNIEYIQALEDGHSLQAPVGFIRISLLEVQALFP